MRSRVLCALAAFGCGSGGSGVDVEVKAPPGTRTVELLVAPSDCSDSDCSNGIAWTTAGPQAPGKIYEVDSDTRNTLEVPASGTVRFQLRSTSGDTIDRVAAIGFDAAGAPLSLKVLHDVVVPTDHAEIWQLTLESITEIGDAPEAPPGTGASKRQHVWRAPPMMGGAEDAASYPSCVVTQSYDDSAMKWDRDFIVPSDRDCDNRAIECNPYWFDFDVGATASACVTNQSGHLPPACLVGGSLCADGRSDSTDCMVDSQGPLLCVPDAACQCTDPGMFPTCVKTLVDMGITSPTASPITYVDCTFDKIVGADTPCQTNGQNQLAIPMPPDCTQVTLYKFAVPGLTMLAQDQGSFTLTNATFSLQSELNSGGGCNVTLTWQTGTANALPAPVLLDVAYATGHVLLPVKVAFEGNTCPSASPRMNCMLYGAGSADHVFQCAQ